MRLRILESVQRRAKANLAGGAEFRKLELQKISIEKGMDAGKVSKSSGKQLLVVFNLRRKWLISKEVDRLLKAD